MKTLQNVNPNDEFGLVQSCLENASALLTLKGLHSHNFSSSPKRHAVGFGLLPNRDMLLGGILG